MKFILAAVVALAYRSPVVSFHVGEKKNVFTKENVGKKLTLTNRRSFFSVASAVGVAGLLSPSQLANAAYYKNGKKVDYFGKPIPLYKSLNRDEEAAKKDKNDIKLLTETKKPETNEQQDRLEAEQKQLEEEILRRERVPPDAPRILVLGGTGTVGKEVRSRLKEEGFFVVATSRDGRDNTLELDVTKCFGSIEKEIFELAKGNRCSAVVSLIGGVGSSNDGLVNGATGQAAVAASKVGTVRNFVAIGPSASITGNVPKGLELYVKAKQLSQDIVTNTFKPDPVKEGMSYTIINPGAIGTSKNYGSDPSVPLETIVNAVIVGATGFYLSESSEILEKVDEISSKASKISKVKELKKV